MGEIEGSYRVLQTPGTRLGAQFNPGISTLEPGQSLSGNRVSGSKSHGRGLQIRVQGLDDSQEFFDVDPKSLGQTLLSEVFHRGNLIESDYFGLEFQNMQMTWVWLEPTKPIARQVRRPANALFRLSVKFFPPDPGQLQEEYTRYLFSLQMKRDLMEGRLICTENTGALLASHLLQSEIGDYDDGAVDREFLRANQLLPYQDKVQERIMELHRRHLGQTPAESDFQILEIARKLEMYGVRFHPAADREGTKINLTVAHMGLQVFQGNTKINTFNWSKIRKLSFKRKRFLIKLHPEVHGPHQDILEFMMASRDQCKNFWKICVEYHSFFRLFDQPEPKTKAILFTRGSSFRYSGRTQKQLVEYVRENGAKKTPYQRRNSKVRMSARSYTSDVPKQILSFSDSPRFPCSTTESFPPAHMTRIFPQTELPPQHQPVSVLSQSAAPPQQQQQQPPPLQHPLGAARPSSPPKEDQVKALPPSPFSFQGAPSNQAAGHCSPMFVCLESATSQSQSYKNDNELNEHGGRRGTGCSLDGGRGKLKGALSPEAFEAELLRTKQNAMLSMSGSPLQVSEEFIDDDPTEISFYGGGAEAYSFGLDEEKVDQVDFAEGLDTSKSRMFSVGIEDLNGNISAFPESLVGHSETSSLVNNRSECSSLDNLGLSSAGESLSVGYGVPDSSSLRLPGSDIQSEASSMVNFPAYSVRSESSSAAQFSDLVEQLEQLSYPPTATEGSGNGSSDSDSDWGFDSNLPPEQDLFYSNPLTGSSGIEGFLLQCHNLQALALADPPGSQQIKM